MGVFISKLTKSRYFAWRDWQTSDNMDEDAKQKQMEYEKDIVKAVNAGDLRVLQQLNDENGFNLWTSLEALNGKTPLLHQAAANGHENVVRFLLDFGLDVDETDSSGMTALHMACKRRTSSCIRLLLERCRDMDKKDVWGRTPLIKALVYRNFDASKILLARGANPNATDIYGMTPLSTAIDYNLMDMVRCLILHGADVNLITQHPCRYSGPPLYLAINNKNLPMVKELLVLGANTQPRIQEYNGSGQVIGPWQYLSFHSQNAPASSSCPANLQHDNAVALAVSEMLKRGEDCGPVVSVAMEIFMMVLAAHGYSLGPSPDVLIRVFINSKPQDFSMLLHKLQVCSSCCSEEMTAAMLSPQSLASSSRPTSSVQQLSQGLRKPPRRVSSLQNQARRKVRHALMASNRNVVWACHRLQCPPALKTLILLKDIDRAFAPSSSFAQLSKSKTS